MVKTMKSLLLLLGGLCPLLGMAQVEKSLATADFPCPPDEINLIYFEDKEQFSDELYLLRHWQIVIDRIFKFKATPKSNSNNWAWELGDANAARTDVADYWDFQIQTPSNGTEGHKGDGIIPANKLPMNNSDLGLLHGDVQASAEIEGIAKTVVSEEDPNEVVKVFFKKDQVHPVSGVPNWFHYWSQAQPIQDLLTIPGIKLWDGSPNCIWKDAEEVMLELNFAGFPYNGNEEDTKYGQSGFNFSNFNTDDPYNSNQSNPVCYNIQTPPRKYGVGYKQNALVVKIGYGCGFKKSNPSGNNPPNIEGIHVFYSTVAHEVEHSRITCKVWADGYDSSLDESMGGDGYKNSWEESTNNEYEGVAGFCPFTPGVNDGYLSNYLPEHLGDCNFYTAGTHYEELRCRAVEAALDKNAVNSFDWSFDPEIDINKRIEGKQW